MWICKKCNYKNNNSSEKCHGHECDGIKALDGIIQLKEISKKERTFDITKHTIEPYVRDYCQNCREKTIFKFSRSRISREGKQGIFSKRQLHYICLQCNRRSIMVGKSENVTKEELEEFLNPTSQLPKEEVQI